MSGDAIRELVQALLGVLGARIDTVEVGSGPRMVIAVTSPDSQMLVGPHGETLSAINTLARRLVEAKSPRDDSTESPTFLVDINGYHEAKLEDLREKARLLASRARLFQHEVELPPMSSYERLVIHEMFADDPEIQTVSVGEGKFRHIVLKYTTSKHGSGMSDAGAL